MEIYSEINSEIYSCNKVLAHNIFAIPVLTPTFGILEWTKQELEDLDIKTRKILTACASFHINSDTDRLYCYQKHGRRGLNGISDTYVKNSDTDPTPKIPSFGEPVPATSPQS